MRVVIVTHFVSPYQAELFNAVAASNGIEIEVVYLHRSWANRGWGMPGLCHEALHLDEDAGRFKQAEADTLRADLVVFNYFAERASRLLLNARAKSRRPWCYWGERPGFRKPEWLGRLRRRYFLSPLYKSQIPIWGIGRFAVEGYRKEFGLNRIYNNLPYFSDLERFVSVNGSRDLGKSERVFLFSGALIPRKGVDLLGRAFLRLAREVSNVRLKVLGEGTLQRVLAQILQPVGDRVEFLGFKDWQELPTCYAAADILCVPSRYDGWGLVVPEGLASGLPVIGTSSMGAAVEFIKTGHNGWLIPGGDETALFSALREAALLPAAEFAGLSRHARDSVSEHSLPQGAARFTRAAHDVFASWQS